ncbi:MAG: glycoside hydrolase family 16 protein [Xanthomonadales bacterium]|jgi:beta-glucanase (GH16 family)|nr:glycoside hydrolase family 16 protein [Xanthomonadales bacterium]
MKRTCLFVVAAFWVAGAPSAQETLLWSDEFDLGTQPDVRIWTYDIGFGVNGWGNRELQYYTDEPENVSLEDGMLHIRAVSHPPERPFTSGRIKTEDKLTILYGTIEARIRVPDLADGLWPAFWTLGNNFSEVGWPMCGELDIMEMGNSAAISDGVINRRIGSTAHWDKAGQHTNLGQYFDAPAALKDDFHVFRMEWTPESVTTFLDGQQVWQIDIRPSSCTSCTEFHQPHFLLLNMAVGGTYTGILDASGITASFPAELVVDWVRVYDNGFTVLGGTGLDATGPAPNGPEHSGSGPGEATSGHGFAHEFGPLGDGGPSALTETRAGQRL